MTAPGSEELAAMTAMKRFDRERELDRNIINGKLAELHTHLLGMGSADFWVSRIMKVYLPRVLQDINISKKVAESKEAEENSIFETLAEDFCKRPFLPKGFSNGVSEDNQTIDTEKKQCWVKELKEIWGEEKLDLSLFTYDVVYGVKQLCKGFNIVRFNDIDIDTDDGNARDANQKADLESLLTPTVECSHQWEFNVRCKKWVIFNQRNWEFEEVEGITNTDLIELIELSPEVLASVRNAFEMLGTSGHKPTEDDRRAQFRGNFTPAFYPQRYALKDCIYEQRIEVLAILLNQVLSRYAKAGVKYVEFSVSAKDMAESRILQTMVFDSFRIAEYEGDDKRLEPEDEYLRVIKSSLDFLQGSLNREATSEEKNNTKELIQRCKNITEAASKNIGCPLNGLEEDGRNEASSESLQTILKDLKEINKILEGGNCFLSYADVLDAQVLGEQIQGCSGISRIELDKVLLFLREQSPNRDQAKDASKELTSWLERTEMKNIYLQEKLDVISRRLVFLNRFTDVRKKLQAILAECCGIEKPNEMLPDIHFEEDAKVSFHKKLLENAKRLLATLKEENPPPKNSSTGNESSAKEKKLTADEILSRVRNTIEENASAIKTTVAQYFGELLREEVKSSRVKYKIFVERILAERKLKSDLKLNHRRSTTYANFYIRVLKDHIIDYASKKALQSGKVEMVNKQMLHAFLKDRLCKSSWEPSWIETYGLYNEYPRGMQFRFLAAFSRVTPFKTLAKSYIDCFLSAEELTDSNVDKIKSKVERAASLSGFDALSFIISLHKGSAHLDDKLCREDFLRKLYVHECDVNSSQNNKKANKKGKKKTDHERDLKNLEDSLNKDRLLCHFLVGLDWVGDELFMPTNWFCTNVVIDFVKRCHQTFNKCFGLRVHGGEGVQRHRANKNAGKAQQVYLLCMHTLITGITKIVEAGIPLRIGHGVAFCVSWAGLGLPKERNPENSTDGMEEPYGRSAATEIIGSERDFEDLYYRLRDFLKRCGDRNVPFEINPTSNDMLLLDTHGTSARAPDQALGAFSSLLELSQSGDSVSWKSGFPRPIICTDNDGIWAIHKCQKHYQHVSIAGEICDLIQRCGNNHPLLLKGAIDRLVDTRGFYFIDVDDPQTPSKEPVDMLSSDSGIEIDNQVHGGEDK